MKSAGTRMKIVSEWGLAGLEKTRKRGEIGNNHTDKKQAMVIQDTDSKLRVCYLFNERHH